MAKIDLSGEQRALLGLAEGESVRLLDDRQRTIVLERIGREVSVAFPWDRPLVLNADVGSFPLADILQLLHTSSKSGFLYFEAAGHEKSVFLHRGEVVFAASNQIFDRLTNCLMRSGGISAEQFEEADRAYEPPERIGKVLVERGFLSAGELWDAVKVQVEEIVRSLFSYDAGSVLFWEGEIRPDNVVRLSLPSERLIAEGLRRRDELIRFLAMLEEPGLSIVRESEATAGLRGNERDLYELLGNDMTFAEVCRIAGVEPLAGARTVRHLGLVGAVTFDRGAERPENSVPEPERRDDEAVRTCVIDHLKLIAELTMPIVAVENATGIAERLGRIVKDASKRHPELFGDLSVRHGGAIDPEDLIRRALLFPGEREAEVRLALGELVSYVEFEVLNNPKIPDPEEFLESTAPLRANL